jgi:hypothetical protein
MYEVKMPNFQSEISFSEKLSEKRIDVAVKLFGKKTVNRIIGIAFFLLGGNREHISKFLDMPTGTFLSLLNRFHNSGVNAFVHQRKGQSKNHEKIALYKPEIHPSQNYLDIVLSEQNRRISLPLEKNELIINSSNQLQLKTVILSFMNSGFLSAKRASEILNLSKRRVQELSKLLFENDIYSLIDKRKGQQRDYTFTEEIKAELIQQFTISLVAGRSTSSIEITKQLNEACQCNVSDRAVRHHILKLGLDKIKKTLPRLLDDLKKTSN